MSLKFNSSPSICHSNLMNETSQKLSYRGGEFEVWQDALRSKVRELIGMPIDSDVSLNVRSLWKKHYEFGVIEKIIFTCEPYSDAVAFLCLPVKVEAPYKCFICLQGHTSGAHNSVGLDFETNSERIEVEGDLDFGISCMANGYAALCFEQRCFGERCESEQEMRSKGTCYDAAVQALMLGRTLLGERVYDVGRCLDFLATRKEIDIDQIGIMGNSGGGYVSMYAAAMYPERIKYCMPSCSFCTFRDSIMSMYHCLDNYVPGLYEQAEMYDIMGLVAPRPLVIVSGKDDHLFPYTGVLEAYKKLEKIYLVAGAENNCKLVTGKGGHRFYAAQAWPLMNEFIC